MLRSNDKTGSTIPPGTVCLEDYQRRAQEVLPHDVYEYLASGCAVELTLTRNRSAFDELSIHPRILTDCSNGNTELELMGRHYRHPIMLAPVAHQGLLHEEAELATAEAAEIMEACMVASTLSSVSMERIAGKLPGHKWFQLYFQRDRGFTLELVRRAEAAGFEALVVTTDAPVNGARNRIQRSGFMLPSTVPEANLLDQPAMPQRVLEAGDSIIFQGLMNEAPTWRDIQWLRANTSLPVLLKGVMHPEDAAICVNEGLQGVIVSNHGGRCLDTVPASIQVVSAIRSAVGTQFPVLLDGGVRRGTDVFKALALGADAILIGRPQVFSLAVAGALGVAHMIKLLRDELEICMALAGCPTLETIGPAALSARR